jgi:P-type E1-E2 ATPase
LLKAASVEQLSSHPADQALLQKTEERKLGKLPIPINFHEASGVGVEGDINGEHIVVGSGSLFENIENALDTKKNVFEGKMLALVTVNEKPAGMISFGDQIRHGISSMIQRLHNLNVKQTVMLTRDSFENAQKIAQHRYYVF